MNILADLVATAARQYGAREALIGTARSMTFADVDAEANRLASHWIGRLGLAKGDRVAILLPNCPEVVVADFALMKAALVRVPVNARYAPPEIEFIVRHSGASVLVTSGAFLGAIEPLLAAPGSVREVVIVEAVDADPHASLPARCTTWHDALSGGSPADVAVPTDDDDGYMIAYTSGTTGRPKGAFTTVRARWANIGNCYANEMFVDADDAMLHVASLAHGSGTKVLPLFAKGARNVLAPKFVPAEFFAVVERHRITISWMVPTMVALLADAFERECHDVSSLRTIIYGGAPCPMPVLERALAAFGPIFVQIYGLTEAPHPDIVLGKREHAALVRANDTPVEATHVRHVERVGADDPAATRAPATVPTGRPAVGVSLRLIGADGRDAPNGEIGEIAIGGPHVMSRYWNDPEATTATLVDGWCMTGDLARIGEDGLYTIVDRRKEMIISGGYNVYPREVEDALYRLPGVAECAIVGAPDPVWGESVAAFIVRAAAHALDEADVVAHCARELAGYKKPRRIVFVDALPKTANGKTDKKALKAIVAAEREAETA